MIKILAIGNSFPQNATRYFKAVADSAGADAPKAKIFFHMTWAYTLGVSFVPESTTQHYLPRSGRQNSEHHVRR